MKPGGVREVWPEDCEPIVKDALDALVRWRGSGDVRLLSGKMVALQFSFLPENRLYSYTLCAASYSATTSNAAVGSRRIAVPARWSAATRSNCA